MSQNSSYSGASGSSPYQQGPPQQQRAQYGAPPPQQQHYGAPPPQQQHYGAPPPQQHYGAPPPVPQGKPGMPSGMKMAGAAAAGIAGGLAIGSIMHHEQEQSDRLDRLEQEQREQSRK